MAKLPANQRHKARLKRTVTQLQRAFQQLNAQFGQTQTMLLAVLAQHGGDITVTAGTIQQILPKLSVLGWQTVASAETPGEFVVRLVDNTPETAEEPTAADTMQLPEWQTQPQEPITEEAVVAINEAFDVAAVAAQTEPEAA